MSFETLTEIYKGIIKSIINYGIFVWESGYNNALNS